jgi:hypothetical protein
MRTKLRCAAIVVILLFLLSTPILGLAETTSSQSGTTLNGDQTIIKDSFILKTGQTLNGNLDVISGTTRLESGSIVNGNVSIVQGELTASGIINGDLSCVNCKGSVADSAEISGNLTVLGTELTVSPKAKISHNSSFNLPFNLGNINFGDLVKQMQAQQSRPTLVARILMTLFVVLAMSALSVLVALLFPRGTRNVASAIAAQPLAAWGVGFLAVLVVEVGSVIMLFTLILIPVSVVLQLALVAAIVFGYVGLGFEVGHRLSTSSNQTWSEPIAAGVGTLLLGMIIGIVSWVPVLGFLILIITPFFGLGAVVLSIFGSRAFPPAKTGQPIAPITPVQPVAPVSLDPSLKPTVSANPTTSKSVKQPRSIK